MSKPTICAKCLYYRGHGAVSNMCTATVKPRLDYITGKTYEGPAVPCYTRNSGHCKYYKEAPDAGTSD